MTTIRADAFSTSRSLGEEFILTPKTLVELDDVSLTFGDLLERFLIEAPNLEYLGPEDTNLILRVRITELRSEFFANSSSHDYYRPSDAELANMKSLVYPPRFKKVPRDDLPVDIHESSLMGPAAFLRELNSMHYDTEPRNQVQDVPNGNEEEVFLDRSLEDVEIENIIDNTVLPTYAGEYMEIRLDPMLAVKEFLLYSRFFIVPDPLKRAVKLGRSDLANEEHVEEYRISFRDNVRIYRSFEVAYTTSLAIQERYKTEYNSVFAILAMYQLSKQKHFGNLFYTEPGDVLCLDPSRSKLDM